MFDNISGSYDRLNHIMSMSVDKSWRRRALRHIVRPEDNNLKVLDLACGTGDFSLAIARRMKKYGISGKVVGVDISAGMLDVMKEKVSRAGMSDYIEAQAGDGEALKAADGSFDRATIAFGIRNFEDRPKGLREMYRVLTPGGKLVILELSVPKNPLLRGLYKLYFLHLLPAVGGCISGDKAAYKYLPASVLNFPAPGDFMKTIREAGFESVFTKSYTLGICRLYVGQKSIQ